MATNSSRGKQGRGPHHDGFEVGERCGWRCPINRHQSRHVPTLNAVRPRIRGVTHWSQSSLPAAQSLRHRPPPLSADPLGRLAWTRALSLLCLKFQIVECPTEGVPPEVAGARMLILDFSGNPHSLYRESEVFTGQYWWVQPGVCRMAVPSPGTSLQHPHAMDFALTVSARVELIMPGMYDFKG